MNHLSPEAIRCLVQFHSQFVLERRVQAFRAVLAQRTRYLTVVLEDIFQPQNASAVLRTCECYGIQDVHIIESANPFRVNPRVVRGASRWLTINRYSEGNESTLFAINSLKSNGYRIVATSPHAQNTLEEFDVARGKIALLFGNELQGLSAIAMQHAQEVVRVPTVGHTECLNLSVSVGICVHVLMARIRSANLSEGLSAQESDALLLGWLRQSQRSWRLMEQRYLASDPQCQAEQPPLG